MHTISTPLAPAAIGPYSQAIAVGDFLYLSGQVALDPNTMMMVQDTLEDEVERIIANIRSVLSEANIDIQNVVKTTIFLTDIADFQKVNEVYGKHFSHKPARSTVGVAALPKWARVEIECIAYRGK